MKNEKKCRFSLFRYMGLLCVIVLGLMTIVGTGENTKPVSTKTVVTKSTDDQGKLEYNNATFQVAGVSIQEPVDVTITQEADEVTLEIASPNYTYNAVTAKSGEDLFLFTQAVDASKYDWTDDTLDVDCATCDEEISSTLAKSIIPGNAGLYKPTPKKLTSADKSTFVNITNMNLQKDITVAVTPYKSDLYIPHYDRIAEDIGYTAATIIAGGDINIVDANGELTTAADTCFCGNCIFNSSNNISSLSTSEISSQITSGNGALLVFKDEKWQKVDAALQSGSVFNNAATVRLYPFVFVITSGTAAETFTLQGIVHDWSSYNEATQQYETIAGATVELSVPLILDDITIDSDTLTVTTEQDTGASYTWEVLDSINGSPITGLTQSGTGLNTYTLDDTDPALAADGQYGFRVTVVKTGSTETQLGIIERNGTVVTIQMNSVAPILFTTTSNASGFYQFTNLDQSIFSQYTIKVTATGYTPHSSQLSGTVVDGVLEFNVWLWSESYSSSSECTGLDTGVTFTPSGCTGWTDADQFSGWMSVTEENGHDPYGTYTDGTSFTAFDCTITINCP